MLLGGDGESQAAGGEPMDELAALRERLMRERRAPTPEEQELLRSGGPEAAQNRAIAANLARARQRFADERTFENPPIESNVELTIPISPKTRNLVEEQRNKYGEPRRGGRVYDMEGSVVEALRPPDKFQVDVGEPVIAPRVEVAIGEPVIHEEGPIETPPVPEPARRFAQLKRDIKKVGGFGNMLEQLLSEAKTGFGVPGEGAVAYASIPKSVRDRISQAYEKRGIKLPPIIGWVPSELSPELENLLAYLQAAGPKGNVAFTMD